MNAPECEPPTRSRILVRGVNWLGDAVMSTAALLRLREANPDAFIALMSASKLEGLWLNHPAIDAVIPFDSGESTFSTARRLRGEHFTVALILPNSFRSALEAWWAGIPSRIGYAGQMRSWLLTRAVTQREGAVRMRKRSRREVLRLVRASETELPQPDLRVPLSPPSSMRAHQQGHQSGQTAIEPPTAAHPLRQTASAHHVYQYLHLASFLGPDLAPLHPQLFVTDTEVQDFLARFAIQDCPGRPLFGLNPGAEYGSAKRWPAESFIAAARRIRELTKCRWLVFGGAADVELAGQITAGVQSELKKAGQGTDPECEVLNLAGATSLRELCAALKACRVVLTNDTGPMHVAAAVGTPVVVPFGSTAPELTGPGLPSDTRHRILRAQVPCAPCFLRQCPIDLRCLGQVTVPHVVDAVMSCYQVRARCWD